MGDETHAGNVVEPMKYGLIVGLLLGFQTAWATDYLNVCHLYRCKASTQIKVEHDTRQQIGALFEQVHDAAAERLAVKQAVLAMYLNAGRQSPIYQDKGGNFRDGSAVGRMDCADHSTNTTLFLNYFAAQGWLKFHRVGQPVYRLPHIIDLHYAALLEDIATGEGWVVDSWFKDFGQAPEVVPLAVWKKGWKPE